MEITPISPITNLRVLKGVPLDSSYTDTITFTSKSAQTAYFTSKAKFSWSNLTPIRVNNVINLPVNQDSLFDCNYIMFQNTNFGDKWLYAFIKDFTYINVNATQVSIEIDAFQTWAFDYTVKESFVTREHSQYDEYGEHILLEPLEVGEYLDEPALRSGHMENYSAVVMHAPQNEGDIGDGVVGGIFTGLTYSIAPLTGSGGAVLDFLQQMAAANRTDSIVATWIMPTDFVTRERDVVEINLTVTKEVDSLGSYIPRNKKLLCYPYNMLCVSNSSGTIKTYRYEYFYNVGSSAIFTMSCPMGVNPEVVVFPRSYDNQNQNFDNLISLSGFPQFGYMIDTYRAWCAQNANQTVLATLGQALGAGISAASGNISGTISGAIGIANTIAGVNAEQLRSNTGAGSQTSSAMVALKAKDFYFYQHHVREDYAKILDDYFDMYGYLTNRVKVPNITGRPYWNYVQTEDAKVVGSIPFDDIVKIKQALNRGITFWHDSDVGNYNRLNSPQEK